jgi:hypothetical protein
MTVADTIIRWLSHFPVETAAEAQKRWQSYFRQLTGQARKHLKKHPMTKSQLGAFAAWCRAIAVKRYPRLPDPHHLWYVVTALTARRVYTIAWRRKMKQQKCAVNKPVQFVPEKMDRLLGLKPTPALRTQLAKEVYRLCSGLPDDALREVAQWQMEGLAEDAIAKKLDMTPAEVGRKLKVVHDRWLKLDPALSKPAADYSTPSGWRLVLRVTAGPQKGRSFKFTRHDTFLVGRSQHAHFRVPKDDQYFSRIHFMVEVNPPSCRLVDMKSRNGTYVNEEKVLTADLQHGDTIRAGHTMLRVFLRDSSGKVVRTQPEQVPIAAPVSPGAVPATSKAAAAAPIAKDTQPGSCPVCGAKRAPAEKLCSACAGSAQALPQVIPGYTLVRDLGGGPLGNVYLALQRDSNVRLTVKLVKPAVAGTAAQIDHLLREARKLCGLGHPRIAAYRDMGTADGQLFFACEFAAGINGEQLLQKSGPLPVARAVQITCQVLEALAFAHDKGFVHRNLKPSNVLVDTSGTNDVITLTDFGLARVYQESGMSGLTLVGDKSGGLVYLAPERITNYRDARPPSDQYAAAALLYRLLTNNLLFDLPATLPEQLLKILQDKPVPIVKRRPEVPKPLAQVIDKALAKEPEKRFGNIMQFRQALMAFET